MKTPIDKLLEQYPIAHELAGWYFRVEQLAPDEWRAIGVDLDGNKVMKEGTTSDVLLRCVSEAHAVTDRLSRQKKA